MILAAEFIGASVTVVNSSNKDLIGKQGVVVDETKHTFTISTSKGTKKLMKKNSEFEFALNGKKIRIKGMLLEHRPEERIKLRKTK